MKQQLTDILTKTYSAHPLANDILDFGTKLIAALEEAREQTVKRLRALMDKYNFDSMPLFSEYAEYPAVTLFKGIDEWTLYPVIDYEGGVTGTDQEIGVIFTDPGIYPEKDMLDELGWELREKIILTWISKLWFDIKGYECGLVVKTLENNSSASFFLNDLAWQDFSSISRYNDKSKRLSPCLNTTPDILTIYQRVSLKPYPVYPYINRWRYFKKGNEIIEFVRYGNETGEGHSGSGDLQLKQHPSLSATMKYEMQRTLELSIAGYEEFLPGNTKPKPIYEGAIETLFHSGEHWYRKEMESRLSLDVIHQFEKQYKLRLPFHFKHYLRLFNGRKYNHINMNFPTGNGYLKVKEFYNLDELRNALPAPVSQSFFKKLLTGSKTHTISWLDIARLTDETKKLSLHLETGKLAIKENDSMYHELGVDFETFIKEPVNYAE